MTILMGLTIKDDDLMGYIALYGWFTVIVTFSFCQERPNFNEILSELKSMSGDGRYNSINN